MKALANLLVVVLAVFVLTATAQAATMTWGPATAISGDSDVSTMGTLLYAQNGGASGNNYTVNGVTFNSAQVMLPVGNVGSGGNSNALPGGGSANYKNLLDSFEYGGATGGTVTLSGLTVGRDYAVQVWTQDARALGASLFQTGYEVGGVQGVVLVNHQDDSTPGEYAIGTFTADAATLDISLLKVSAGGTWGGTQGVAVINALQVRDVTVPEPSSLMLLTAGLLGLLAYAWKKRR